MDKLRDQLTMALKDSVIARHEIKDRIAVTSETIKMPNDKLDVLVRENEQLRQLLVQVRKSLVVMSQEVGVDVPDEQALSLNQWNGIWHYSRRALNNSWHPSQSLWSR